MDENVKKAIAILRWLIPRELVAYVESEERYAGFHNSAPPELKPVSEIMDFVIDLLPRDQMLQLDRALKGNIAGFTAEEIDGAYNEYCVPQITKPPTPG